MDPSSPADEPPLTASLWAGAASGMVGVAGFFVFHTLWIFDTPAVLLDGPVIAALAGLAVGWAYHHLHVHAGFPADWRGGLLLAVTLWLLLVPYEVLGLLIGPLTQFTRPSEQLMVAPVTLIGVPFAAALGWALTHQARPTVALTVATFLLHFMLGGSLVFFGGRGILLGLFAWMLPTYLLAGLVLVRVRSALLGRMADDRAEERLGATRASPPPYTTTDVDP